MLNDGSNTVLPIRATTPNMTSATTPEQIKRLEKIQQKLWAVLGLKMACDRLKDLGYDVVVHQENGRATIELELKVDLDFDSGLVGGKDVVSVQTELKRQIEELKNGEKT